MGSTLYLHNEKQRYFFLFNYMNRKRLIAITAIPATKSIMDTCRFQRRQQSNEEVLIGHYVP
ncbi:MAG TPA: hypothetical protein DEQ06_02115 [Porphyromonadaceae bacterium]|nr:hypothetical protein [Porphyromonadaceae bacterium]